MTPDAPRTFKGPEALREVREAVREDLFIEATAQGLLGGKGRSFEYSAIIFKEVAPTGEIEFSHTCALPGEGAEVEFTSKELISRVKETRRAQGKSTGEPEIFEVAHTHPSGIRASFEYATERLSGPDIEAGRAGAEGAVPAVPSNVALVTPSGGYDVVGFETEGRVEENVLPRMEANRLGFRPDYRPRIPDLAGAVRARIEHIVAQRRTELTDRLGAATGGVQRRLERQISKLDAQEARALRRLELQVRRGRL